MSKHDTKIVKPQPSANRVQTRDATTNMNEQNTVQIFNDLQGALNANIQKTVAQQPLDTAMFEQTIEFKQRIGAESRASQKMFGEQSRQVLDQNDVKQAEINDAFANPFHDITAFFSGNKSTDELLNDQKVLAGQLGRIHKDNTTTNAMFEMQLNTVNEGLKDQLGISKLRADQGVELEKLINRQTKIETSRKTYEDDVLEGESLRMLQLRLNNFDVAGDNFSKGRVIKWMQIKQNEALDLANKQRKARNGGKEPTREDVIGFTGMDTLLQRMNAMTNLGIDSTVIDGFQFSKAQLDAEIKSKRKSFQTDAGAIDNLNASFALASGVPRIQAATVARLNPESLPLKNQGELQAAKFLSDTFEDGKSLLQEAIASGETVDPNQFRRLQVLARNTFDMAERAVRNAAVVKASDFTNESANKSAIKFYEGKPIGATDGRNILTELVLTETSSAIAKDVGIVLGPVLSQFSDAFANSMASNFADNSVKAGDTDGFDIEVIKQQMAEQGKVNKLNSAVSWTRTMNEGTGRPQGEEQNRWVAQISDQLLAVQIHGGVNEFLQIPELLEIDEVRDALVTTSGRVKGKFIAADADSINAIAQELAVVGAKLKVEGSIPEDFDLAKLYLDTMRSESIMNLARRQLEKPNIALQSMLRGLYGDDKATSSYLGAYLEKLGSVDTAFNEKESLPQALEIQNRKDELNNAIVQQGLGGLMKGAK